VGSFTAPEPQLEAYMKDRDMQSSRCQATIHGGAASAHDCIPKDSRRRNQHRRSTTRFVAQPSPECNSSPVAFLGEDLGDAEELIMAAAPVAVNVSMDSGAVAHVANPEMLPAAAIKPPARVRSFRAANGGAITHHGTARVAVVGEKMPWRRALMEFEAADVNRALQSTGATCDQGKEVLFTRDACYVVTAGLLSPVLKRDDIVQAFRREPNGGLYTRAVQVSIPPVDGQQLPVVQPGSAPPAEPSPSFTRPGGM